MALSKKEKFPQSSAHLPLNFYILGKSVSSLVLFLGALQLSRNTTGMLCMVGGALSFNMFHKFEKRAVERSIQTLSTDSSKDLRF